jgi:hypothetical protein
MKKKEDIFEIFGELIINCIFWFAVVSLLAALEDNTIGLLLLPWPR